ncbi:MAG: hypothetical protein V1744_04740 [Candidatus Altiarchaeota archaeon]
MTGLFTLDATMAVVITTLVLATAMYMLLEPKGHETREHLYQLTGDLLAVAEETRTLDRIVRNDLAGWENLKSNAPQNVCLQLNVMNETDNLVYTDETECEVTDFYTVGRRTFISDSKFYSAQMRVWLK